MKFTKIESELEKPQTEEFWRSQVETYKRSELTKAQYCESRELHYTRFSYWFRKLSRPESSLIPLKLKGLRAEQALCAKELSRGQRVIVYEEQLLFKLLNWLDK